MDDRKNKMIFLVRFLHTIVMIFFLLCIFYVYYCILTNQTNFWLFFSMSSLFFEGAIVLINDKKCPLRPLHLKYGDKKGLFELYFPKKATPYVFPFLAVLASIGILINIIQMIF